MLVGSKTSTIRQLKDVSRSDATIKIDDDIFIQDLVNLESPILQKPKSPSKSPLFCCFYAEFDIKKGPVIRHQCPKHFMDQDINTITTSQIHDILATTFAELAEKSRRQSTIDHQQSDDVPNGPNSKGDGDETVPPCSGSNSDFNASTRSNDDSVVFLLNTEEEEKGDDAQQDVDGTSRLHDGGQSIFDSTSEYIITGSQLTGKVITLSTHDMHIMTRPTQISDQRYERNALLFSIGFVLRRAADPRPFRPLISKLAMTLRSMEMESGMLSGRSNATRIQSLLEKVLVAMNSPRWECNLLLNESTALNLKLFHPPKPKASPVHEYQVPVLLRRDLQLQLYEWDLAINWVILHIDGITNAWQISLKAEVDLEMVLACLRVLKHHGVLHVVDMFLYTNRYEFTDRATAMLAGKEEHLLHEAVAFAVKRPTTQVMGAPSKPHMAAPGSSGTSSANSVGSDGGNTGTSPKSGSPYFPSSTLVAPSAPSSSYPPRTLNLLAAGGSQRSSNFRFAMMAVNSLDREAAHTSRQSEENHNLKSSLAELYCACNRNVSFGDLWMALTAESPAKSSSSSHANAHPTTVAGGKQRSVQNQQDSYTVLDTSEKNEVIVASPMEAILIASMKRRRSVSVSEEPTTTSSSSNNNSSTTNKSSMSHSNWRSTFMDFDHRRFITFGIVHGLLVRIHAYPYYSGPTFPEKRLPTQDLSSAPTGAVDLSATESSTSFRHPINFGHEMKESKNFQLAKAAAAAMDGTRCDDELVCKFELPMEKIADLVEKYSGKKVMYMYSTLKS